MAQQANKQNSFNDKTKPATITAVDPQKKTVTIKYSSQDGIKTGLNLNYSVAGASYGRLHMPQIGDRVLIDYTQGDLPIITQMLPANTDFLPYLDPGELVDMNSDGSYVQLRNARRRVKSTGALIDYSATQGPNGETDIETEPGGVIVGIRSKQDISTKAPRWYEHSYLSMFENGDISLQSRFQGNERGLLYMDGATGYVFLVGGMAKPQEYIELDPVNKRIVILSDGDIHQFNQKDWKITVYNNQVQNIGNALQLNIGVPPSQIPADFDEIMVDSDVQNGDIKIVNTLGTSGKFTLDIKGDTVINVAEGNVTVEAVKGNVSVIADQGNISATASNGDITATAQTINISSDSDQVYVNGGSAETDRIATIKDIQNHYHGGVTTGHQDTSGGSTAGSGRQMDQVGNYTGNGKAYLGQ
jgi:hypothetical protein